MKLKKFDLEHKPCYWWLRSTDIYCDNLSGYVDSFEFVNYNYIDTRHYVFVFCFMI